jgi:DNA-binding winged helix-turn-helix (wHTH) protein
MSLTKNDIYRFDEFERDPSSRTFSRNGAQTPLYPKAFEILKYPVGNPGRSVTKEEIFQAAWRGQQDTRQERIREFLRLVKGCNLMSGYFSRLAGSTPRFTSE